jgi:hypothetical protein
VPPGEIPGFHGAGLGTVGTGVPPLCAILLPVMVMIMVMVMVMVLVLVVVVVL